ncbi:MAG: hypothetical protein WCY95_07990, partial [Castellaniella sp.]
TVVGWSSTFLAGRTTRSSEMRPGTDCRRRFLGSTMLSLNLNSDDSRRFNSYPAVTVKAGRKSVLNKASIFIIWQRDPIYEQLAFFFRAWIWRTASMVFAQVAVDGGADRHRLSL